MTATVTDLELLEAWRGGDRQAGEQLFERHFDAVARFFRNKVDSGIDDLIQRTFLACAESIERFRGDGSFRGYLFAIARNELRLHFMRKQQLGRRQVDLGSQSVVDLGTSPSIRMEKQQESRLLQQALREIPVDLQIVIELHHWEGLTMIELAQVLEIPVGTAKSRVRRAKEMLVGVLRRQARSRPALLQSTLDGLEHHLLALRK